MDSLSLTLSKLSVEEGEVKTSPHKIASSQYGMYVNLNCNLYLRKSCEVKRNTNNGTRVNNVSERMQLRGSNWENLICHELKSQEKINNHLKYIDCTNEDFETKLRYLLLYSHDSTLEYYLYQATMQIPPTEKYIPISLLSANASISRIIPDLLKLQRKTASDPWTLIVIDAKSSLKLKQSHQAQVAFYSYFLEKIFEADIASGSLRMSPTGGVWLQTKSYLSDIFNCLEFFQLKPWLSLLTQHLTEDILAALSGSLEDVPWQLNTSCASCPYLADCRAPKVSGVDIRSLPHISRSDSKFLQKIALEYSDGSSTLPRPAKFAASTLLSALQNREYDKHTSGRVVKILGGSGSTRAARGEFGSLTSLLESRVIVKDRLCGLIPMNNSGFSVYISLHCDPALDLPYAFGVILYFNGKQQDSIELDKCDIDKESTITREKEQAFLLKILSYLCNLIDYMVNSGGPSTTVSFYMWDGLEKFFLTQLVVKSLCGEFGPLSDALSPRVHYLARVLLDYPQQWDLFAPTPPLEGDIKTLSNGAATSIDISNSTPRMCDITQAYKSLVLLPITGFYSPSDIHTWIESCKKLGDSSPNSNISAGHTESTWIASGDVRELVRIRLLALVDATEYLRNVVVAHDPRLLFNSSPPLPYGVHFPTPVVTNNVLQRLIFMKEVDLLIRCSSARYKRITSLNNPPDLVKLQCKSVDDGQCIFVQISGSIVFEDSPASVNFKKWVLSVNDPQVLASFTDLNYISKMGFIPGNTCRLVSVVNTFLHDEQWCLGISLLGNASLFAKVGREYLLFPREMDFNVAKSLTSLTQALQRLLPPTFEALLSDPNRWSAEPGFPPLFIERSSELTPYNELDEVRKNVNIFYRSLGDLNDSYRKLAPLTGAQAQAFKMLLTERLTILWGPPGTGKTHFAAKSILNLIEMAARLDIRLPTKENSKQTSKLHVLVTASTHAAIDEILSKFVDFKNTAENIPNRQDVAAWKDKNCEVFKFGQKSPSGGTGKAGFRYGESYEDVIKSRFCVVGATPWVLHSEKSVKNFVRHFDLVVVDEASQMPVADALMPLSCIRPDPGGRLLVIGDTLQLPPIFAHTFGRPPRGTQAIQGSILECLLRTDTNEPVDLAALIAGQVSPPPRMVKLRDNYRMNTELSRFTSRLYGEDYVPADVSRNRDGRWKVTKDPNFLIGLVPSIVLREGGDLSELISVRLVPHALGGGPGGSGGRLLTENEVITTSEKEQLAAEAGFISALIQALALSSADFDADSAARNIFACTPHNKQKAMITKYLADRGHHTWTDITDTAEHMQGQERDVVIICLGYFSTEMVSKEVDFLFSKQRLNVAISRAKKTCILVYTDAMVALNPDVIGNPRANEAYEHLLAFIAASAKIGCSFDVPAIFSTFN